MEIDRQWYEPKTVATEVGAADAGVGERGSGFPDAGDVLHGICEGSPVVWVGDVGYVPVHWVDLGRIPTQGGPHNYGEATAEGTGWDVGETPVVGGNVGSGPIGGRELCCPPL